jgi:hypothetical protein
MFAFSPMSAFTELVLLVYVPSSAGKIAFSIVKSCTTKEYEDGNAALALEKLKRNKTLSLPLCWLRLKECLEKVN